MRSSMEKLSITADREEFIVGLTGKLVLDEFSGIGEGWHNNSEVLAFCTQLEEISKTMIGSAELVGGEGTTELSEFRETFAIRVMPINQSKLNGTVSVHIIMSNTPYTHCRVQEIQKVSGELKVRNHRLEKFAHELRSLLSGDLDTVLLEGDNVI